MGAYSVFPLLGGFFVFTAAFIGLGYCRKWGDVRIAFALFLILWTTYASIGPGDTAGNDNVVTRMGLVYAIIDNHSVTIDAFAPFTGDKAKYGGHYYLDKAPGLSLTALPAVGVFLSGLRALHISAAPIVSGEFTTSYYATVWLASWATSALFTAAAAVALISCRGIATQAAQRRSSALSCSGWRRRRPAGPRPFSAMRPPAHACSSHLH
jgi:hypothetical protein